MAILFITHHTMSAVVQILRTFCLGSVSDMGQCVCGEIDVNTAPSSQLTPSDLDTHLHTGVILRANKPLLGEGDEEP